MKKKRLILLYGFISLLILLGGAGLAACSSAALPKAQAASAGLYAITNVSVVDVKANPLEDIRNARLIESVFLNGKYFSRQNLDRLLQEARELAQQPGSTR